MPFGNCLLSVVSVVRFLSASRFIFIQHYNFTIYVTMSFIRFYFHSSSYHIYRDLNSLPKAFILLYEHKVLNNTAKNKKDLSKLQLIQNVLARVVLKVSHHQYHYLSNYTDFQLSIELNLNWLLLHTVHFLLNNRHT